MIAGVTAADEIGADTFPEAEMEEIDWRPELEERTEEIATEPLAPELMPDDKSDADDRAELGVTEGPLDTKEAPEDGLELGAGVDEMTTLEREPTALLKTDEGTESELTDAAKQREAEDRVVMTEKPKDGHILYAYSRVRARRDYREKLGQ